ncbi:MAG: Rho termination factor N-terminal domain-containing protein [Chitinophagaceae bacterium]
MYDISQLNDMLVPELQDIAIEQNIPNHQKLEKQDLISQILQKQSIMANVTEGEKPKRKRMSKTSSTGTKRGSPC